MEKPLLEKLIKKTENHPYHKFIGLRVMEEWKGSCRIKFSPSGNTRNLTGVVHGGIYYTVLDVAAFVASATVIPDERLTVTSDINISVLAAVSEGDIIVDARVLKTGKRNCIIDSRAFDSNGNLVAIARVTKSIIPFPQMKELLEGAG
ncbi:MAG: PaaI family thioesterase [Syntrophales bacterium]